MTGTAKELLAVLTKIDWPDSVAKFGTEDAHVTRLTESLNRLALWSREFEDSESSNPAIEFVREMQIQGIYTVTLASISLYRPAAAAMRAALEAALYYSYFRTHPAELSTIARSATYHLSKEDILEFHQIHTMGFPEREKCLNLVTELREWYRRISSVVHGKKPGSWVVHTGIADIKYNAKTLKLLVDECSTVAILINNLFLTTCGHDLWPGFSVESKRMLLKGLSGQVKTTLGLSVA